MRDSGRLERDREALCGPKGRCPLDEYDFPVVMLDGTGFDDHLLVVALGIDTEGRKHVLGVAEGSTESEGEGLEETLTLTSLGFVKGTLLRTLCTTNPIENLQGTLKKIARNVKRWRGGSMALRWAVTGLMEAEKKFRRVRGYRELPKLIAAIEAKVNEGSLDNKRRVA